MRHTLIPTALKRSLRHEYRVRALVVLLFMLSLAGVIGVVSVLPAFVRAVLEDNSAERTLAPLVKSNDETNAASSSAEAAKQSNVLALFNDQSKTKTDHSYIILTLVAVRGSVKLTSVDVSRTATTSVSTVLKGIAPSRDALIAFKGRLESAIAGNKVDLPVSELAKSKDIQFSLTVTNDKTP